MSCFPLENYKVQNFQPTAFYISDYITQSEERAILNNIYSAPKPKWTQLSNRRLQNWGGIPHNRGMIPEGIPAWLDSYLERIHHLDVMAGHRPNHVLVNEYLPGQGIMPHVDGSLFYPTITTISVGSHVVLRFTEIGEAGGESGALLLEPRSLLVLCGRLYTHYTHGIQPVAQDSLDDSILNLSLCSDNYVKGCTMSRDTRVSLTIRHVPKTCRFKINIGNNRR